MFLPPLAVSNSENFSRFSTLHSYTSDSAWRRYRFGVFPLLSMSDAGIEHQLKDISEDFAMWRVFYGPASVIT